MLSQVSIKEKVTNGEISITPFAEKNLKPASYTFTLSSTLIVDGETITMPEEGFSMTPGGFVVGITREHLKLNGNYSCILSTRGSIAQAGVDMLNSSTVAEPDTDNPMKLEIVNHSSKPFVLFPGMNVVKGCFFKIV